MADNTSEIDPEYQSGLDANELEQDASVPASPEPEELSEACSPRSDGDSDYEDAPSRLDESQLQENVNVSAVQENEQPCKDDEIQEPCQEEEQEDGDENKNVSDTITSPSQAHNLNEALSPGIGDETIYASASESFLSEAGDKDVQQKEDDNPSEDLSEDNAEDTNDPLGLDEEEDSNIEGIDDKEEGEEGEEGELEGDEETEDPINMSAYQTEPVSSDDDLDAVQNSDNQDTSGTKNDQHSDTQHSNKVISERTGSHFTGSVHNGHAKTENDLNHEDHVELDYEEDLDEGDKLRGDSKLDDDEKEDGEDGAYTSGSDQEGTKNGEEEDCEEGEIVDDDDFRHEPRRLCRFFSRGHCTWGVDCRFLHPGINDKGNYSLIEKPLGPPSMAGRLGPQPWHRPQDRPPEEEELEPEEEEEPPPPSPPREETAWERGLRHAKEMRKLAKKRKEQETNFEEKKMNLSLEDVENKENYREPERVESRTPTKVYLKDPYYDNVYDSDEEYYREDAWQDGHYQNFEVRWTRGPDDYPPEDYRPHRGERDRLREKPHYRERRPSPPPDYRYDRMRREESGNKRPDKHHENKYREGPPASQKKSAAKPDIIRRETGPAKATRGDEWHDPWQRTNKEVPKKRPVSDSRSRSRSKGRRRRRSISSSSSYTSRSRSSSFSSRSSSYSSSSSYSGRSSSRSSSSSRSRSPRQRRPPLNRSGPPPAGMLGSAAAGVSRRAPPIVGRGISASTKSGGPASKGTAQKNAPSTAPKPVARVPMVARVPSVPSSGKEPTAKPPGRNQPSKAPPLKQPIAGVEKKSQRPELARPSPVAPKQGNDSQKRPAVKPGAPPSKSASAAAKPGVKPGASSTKPGTVDARPGGDRIPHGQEDRSRKPGRGIPSRLKRQASSSSSSSRSRSRSYSSSSSRSSSGSSRSSSSSSGSSSGSADSDNLYRGVGKTGRRNMSPSPLRRKVPVPADKLRKQPNVPGQERQKARVPNANKPSPSDRRKLEMDKTKERDKKAVASSKQSPTKPLPPRDRNRPPESDSRVRSSVSSSSGLAPAKPAAKDPLKVSGQKQSIKLTLSNKDRPPDKGSSANAAKKRPAVETEAPPSKKVARSPSKEIRTVTKGPPEKVASRSRSDSNKSPPAAKKPAESPAKSAKGAAPAKGKKSMSSRREELLKQLKAVEDAIARKRAKMN